MVKRYLKGQITSTVVGLHHLEFTELKLMPPYSAECHTEDCV